MARTQLELFRLPVKTNSFDGLQMIVFIDWEVLGSRVD